MILTVYIVAALLVLTKLADVISTLARIRHADAENNPVARRMMHRIGTEKAIWLVMFIALVIIIITAATALRGGLYTKVLFTLAGLVISLIQFAVAHCNWTGRDNLITRRVRTIHVLIQRIIQKQ
jgi:hypothetical protein